MDQYVALVIVVLVVLLLVSFCCLFLFFSRRRRPNRRRRTWKDFVTVMGACPDVFLSDWDSNFFSSPNVLIGSFLQELKVGTLGSFFLIFVFFSCSLLAVIAIVCCCSCSCSSLSLLFVQTVWCWCCFCHHRYNCPCHRYPLIFFFFFRREWNGWKKKNETGGYDKLRWRCKKKSNRCDFWIASYPTQQKFYLHYR